MLNSAKAFTEALTVLSTRKEDYIMAYAKTTTIEENTYIITAEARSTRNGFAHDCKIWKNNRLVSRASCHYINRTWEEWTYKTVITKAFDTLINDLLNRFIQAKKEELPNIYKRITQKKRINLMEEFYEKAEVKEFMKVKDMVIKREL